MRLKTLVPALALAFAAVTGTTSCSNEPLPLTPEEKSTLAEQMAIADTLVGRSMARFGTNNLSDSLYTSYLYQGLESCNLTDLQSMRQMNLDICLERRLGQAQLPPYIEIGKEQKRRLTAVFYGEAAMNGKPQVLAVWSDIPSAVQYASNFNVKGRWYRISYDDEQKWLPENMLDPGARQAVAAFDTPRVK